MHISTSRNAFLQNIQRCQSIVEKRSTNAILANLLLEASDSSLQIVATDLQLGLRSKCEASVHAEGKVTVSAKKLFDIIKELDADHEVELKTKDAFVEITSGRSKFRLSTLPAMEYPGLPENDTDLSLSIEGKELADMIAATSFAMSMDETRKYLTGTLFETTDGLRLVTTDGHRLAMVARIFDQAPENCQCIVPRKSVLEIRKLAEEADGQVTLSLGKRQVRLEAGDHLLTSKVIDANFPAYEDVIPKENPRAAVVDRHRLDQVMRRSMIVANEFTHDVRVEFVADGLKVMAHNNEQEQAEELVDADYTDSVLSIGFNGRYIRDVLGAMNASRVVIQFRDELSPVLLLEEGNEAAKYVVMPMRI